VKGCRIEWVRVIGEPFHTLKLSVTLMGVEVEKRKPHSIDER